MRSSREEVPTQQFQQLIEALSATTGEHKETVMNMKKYSIKDVGIQLLLKKYKNIFRFSLLFQPPVIFVNSKAPFTSLVYTKWRALFHFILVIILLLLMSCSSQQIVELPEGSLITMDDL